ncbi:MAG: integrase arm-type DNA-binding domain-containing protein [Thermoanaerobaculia bacterium]|nr:integrase arm-type DNA-binding domain-containing protein [Thermoanaerobaculia bacterium]
MEKVLTAAAIRGAKPREKAFKLFDGAGLYLEVTPAGGRLWRFKYRYQGRERKLALGKFPEVSLAAARDRHHEARKALAQGRDPGAETPDAAFAAVAERFAESRSWTPQQCRHFLRRLEIDLFPYLGSLPVGAITAPQLRECLARIEDRGAIETAHRVLRSGGQVFRYAIAQGLAQHDPSAALRGMLSPVEVTHHAAITDPAEFGELLRAIEGYRGDPATRAALRLAPLVFVRPGELRAAEWGEFDLAARVWLIPASRMKGKRDHLVPLSRQAVEIVKEMFQRRPADGRYMFAGLRTPDRPMSEGTLAAALRRLGYSKTQMTWHGFRASARTLIVEHLKVPAEIVERQLAHGPRTALGRSYDRTEFLAERVDMMRRWADLLDFLRGGGAVLRFQPATSATA